MPGQNAPPDFNRLLQSLPRAERSGIVDACERVDLDDGAVLCAVDRTIRQVYFPETVWVSLTEALDNGQHLATAFIGAEGMVGATLLLGVCQAPSSAVVQHGGMALRMSAARFSRAVDSTPSLERAVKRYLNVMLRQLSRLAACTHFHDIESRLAGCLLSVHDRADGDELHLTHANLAQLLGVRRSGVTLAAGVLQRRMLIRYGRGIIRILDRERLEATCCGCHAAEAADYARCLGAVSGRR
jgi:CRP-like cAMP-binding protein